MFLPECLAPKGVKIEKCCIFIRVLFEQSLSFWATDVSANIFKQEFSCLNVFGGNHSITWWIIKKVNTVNNLQSSITLIIRLRKGLL